MLKKNHVYSSKYLLENFGGNIQASMPIVNGAVPYCKFDPKINHKFPTEVWIEVGPIRKKGTELMLETDKKIPVFQKLATNQWKYLGEAVVSDLTTPKKLQQLNKAPPRDKIQKILGLLIK